MLSVFGHLWQYLQNIPGNVWRNLPALVIAMAVLYLALWLVNYRKTQA